MSDWPVHSDSARSAALDMLDTHRAVPISAYDVKEQLINPRCYRQHLQGCLAECHFKLSHCSFKLKDTYTADIETIRVLRPPPPATMMRTKRKLPTKFESPNVKSQVN
ncbi:hypothetical protein JVT61DRAFT_10779 [Boletus reticuloceps]|uniref:Uncharacterized protein n=1 Tax=Boletus reticuloceps TaxID=495285 RepID=A0A8I2YFJ7_9AGAM|nr:hypothetical protein JVT61DRAFT_10779 [Boletus reticuloceps]